jgi:hypothetical protein
MPNVNRVSTLCGCVFLALLVGFRAVPVEAQAQVNTTWIDSTGNWSNSANWNNGVPNGNFSAFIGNGSSPNPLANLDINATVNNLTLNSGGVLIQPGSNLTLANLYLSGNNSFLTGATGSETLTFVSYFDTSGISGNGTVSNVNLSVFADPFFTITNGAKVSTSGSFANNGFGDDQFTISNGSVFTVNGGFRTCCDLTISASQMNVTGSWDMNNAEVNYLNLSSGATVNVGGGFDSSNFVAGISVTGGSVLNVGGSFYNEANAYFSALGVTNGGAVNVGGNYTSAGLVVVDISNGSMFNVRGNLSNLTTYYPIGEPFVPSLTISNGSVVSVGRDLTNSGVISLTTGSTGTVYGAFNNSGSVSVDDSSALDVKSGFNQTAGSTVINGVLDAKGPGLNITGGVLEGNGTIRGNVMMAGTIMPGAAGAPGVLTIWGNYLQTNTGVMNELIGAGSSSLLNVKGTAGLDSGALSITLLGGFDPVGDKFDIMNYKSLSGDFSNGTNFVADGYDWTLNYGSKDTTLTAVRAVTPEPSTYVFLVIGGLVFGLVEFLRRRG